MGDNRSLLVCGDGRVKHSQGPTLPPSPAYPIYLPPTCLHLPTYTPTLPTQPSLPSSPAYQLLGIKLILNLPGSSRQVPPTCRKSWVPRVPVLSKTWPLVPSPLPTPLPLSHIPYLPPTIPTPWQLPKHTMTYRTPPERIPPTYPLPAYPSYATPWTYLPTPPTYPYRCLKSPTYLPPSLGILPTPTYPLQECTPTAEGKKSWFLPKSLTLCDPLLLPICLPGRDLPEKPRLPHPYS